jgi:16S rRNA (guanine527-N7)-methyltransferase
VHTIVAKSKAVGSKVVSRETFYMPTAIERLQLQSESWGLALDLAQLSLLSEYADMLATYELANIIGTKDREQIIQEHLTDSLSCLIGGLVGPGDYVVDVGTGGGLPGVPLSIASPAIKMSLLESAEKKVSFLEHARSDLDLGHIEILHNRAEVVGRKREYREAFDLAVTRALAPLPVVLEYCTPLVRTRGAILAMKARLPEEELTQGIEASRELGVELREVQKVDYIAQLPQKERRLVIFDKIREAQDRFPRRVGLAKKRPLGI